jgi:uncharacterized protein YydD (DUF2326 family)
MVKMIDGTVFEIMNGKQTTEVLSAKKAFSESEQGQGRFCTLNGKALPQKRNLQG